MPFPLHCDSVLLVSALKSSLCFSGCCKSVTLSATGAANAWPDHLGSYVATGEELYRGATVYRKSDDYPLYSDSDGTWRAGMTIGHIGAYSSVDTADCPASISQWQYWADEVWDWQSGNITAQCSVHT